MTILDRYEKARSISRAAAAAAGVPVRYLWQPTRYDRPVVEGEIHWSSEGEVRPRVLSQILADHLPDDVVNVKDALDGHPEPVYTDDVHHNEEASRIIARAIYDRIRPDLLALGR